MSYDVIAIGMWRMELGLALISEWRELIISLMEPCLMLAPVNDWVAPIATPFKEEKDPKKDEAVRSTAPPGLPEPPQQLPPPPPEPWYLGTVVRVYTYIYICGDIRDVQLYTSADMPHAMAAAQSKDHRCPYHDQLLTLRSPCGLATKESINCIIISSG